jgi:hypothetical protein
MSPRAWVVGAGLAVILLIVVLASAKVGPLELVVLLALLAGAVALAGGRGGVLRFETSASPQEVISAAITLVGTHRRWATLAHTDVAATFSYHRPPSKLIAFLLLLCFVVPGIVYLVLAGKRESLSIATSLRADRTAVQATASGWRGRRASRELDRQLGAVAAQATIETST